MPQKKSPQPWKSSSWKLTLIFAGAVSLILVFSFAMVYRLSVANTEEMLNQQIVQELSQFQKLGDILTKGEFHQYVSNQMQLYKHMILVWDDSQERLGNLSFIPQEAGPWPEVERFTVYSPSFINQSRLQNVLGSVIETQHGRILVALDLNGFDALSNRLTRAMMITIALALLLTLLAGYLITRKSLSRLELINKVVMNIEAGDMGSRITNTGQQDELGYLSDRINQMLDAVDHAMQSVQSATDNIAHDLRTPLSRISIRLEQLLSDPDLDESVATELEQLSDELQKLLRTFQSMLELTRLEQGVELPGTQTCNLANICRDAAELIQPLADERQLRISLNTPFQPTTHGEPNLLFRACFNLLENAVHYSPPKTTIEIATTEHGWVIKDSGPGVPASKREKVFERLYRLDSSRARSGFGMGLPMVRAVISRHNGSVVLEDNHPDKKRPGLKVSISLPEGQ